MSWAGIASNQTISFTNLKDACTTGVFTEISTITASDEQVTATDVGTYTDAIVAGGVASNQLPVKSELTSQSYQIDLSCDGTTNALACALSFTCAAYVKTQYPVFGTVFYSNSGQTTLYDFSAYAGIFIKVNSWDNTSGQYKCRIDFASSSVNNGPQSCP